MRVFVLAAVLAALVWLGWRAFAPEQEAQAAGPQQELGRPMAAPPQAVGTQTASGAAAEVPAREPGGSNSAQPVEIQPAKAPFATEARDPKAPAPGLEQSSFAVPEPGAARADEIEVRPGTGRADETRIGRTLAHQLQNLAVVLGEERQLLGQERALLVEALADALGGRLARAEDAQGRLERSAELRFEELEGLRRLIAARRGAGDGRPNLVLPVAGAPALVLGALIAHDAEVAAAASERGEAALAVAALSQCLQGELAAPWPAERQALAAWSQQLDQAQQGHRWNPRGDWPSVEVEVRPGDSLIGVRKRVLEQQPELLVCVGQIARGNRLRGDVIQPGEILRVPRERAHVLVDLGARWMLYLLGEEVVAAWEVGIGRPGQDTRPGVYTVGEKREEPMWWRPGEEPVPYGDPANPLGTRWIEWQEGGKSTGLGFHGTVDPQSIGQAVSDGCIRLRNPDVEELFEILPRGAEIEVRP